MFILALGVILVGAPESGRAADFSFIRLADSSAPIPGGTGNFTAFPGLPSLSGNQLLFDGVGGGGQQGFYLLPGSRSAAW